MPLYASINKPATKSVRVLRIHIPMTFFDIVSVAHTALDPSWLYHGSAYSLQKKKNTFSAQSHLEFIMYEDHNELKVNGNAYSSFTVIIRGGGEEENQKGTQPIGSFTVQRKETRKDLRARTGKTEIYDLQRQK